MRKFTNGFKAVLTTPIGAVILIVLLCGLSALSEYIG